MQDDAVKILGKCTAEIEQHLHAIIAPPTSPHVATIHALLDAVVQARISRDNMAAVRLLHKVSRRFKRPEDLCCDTPSEWSLLPCGDTL